MSNFIARITHVVAIALGLAMTGNVSAEPSYVGNKGCVNCHKSEAQDWQFSNHGKVFELLEPGKRSSAKIKAALDPDKDYRNDEKCLKCHTTGAGKEGGFVDIESTPDMGAAGCEMCHGPGSEYREIHKANPLAFKRSETRAAGQIYASRGDKMVCEKCHGDKSPFKPSVDPKYKFDLQQKLKKNEAFHQYYELDGKHD